MTNKPEKAGVVQSFWAKVDKRGPDECWPWLGAKASTNALGKATGCACGDSANVGGHPMVEITQSDRDAAANMWRDLHRVTDILDWQADWMEDGTADNGPVVQAFKAHRQAHAPASEEYRRDAERVCTVCTATVAAYPEGMCCHCHELPWPLKDQPS